jgi:hypothetical protein
MNSKPTLAETPLLTLIIALLSISAQADTHTWNGGGADNNWTTAANWGGTSPVSGDSLSFDGNTRLTPSNNFAAGTAFSNVTFNSNAGAFILSGNTFALGGAICKRSTSGFLPVPRATSTPPVAT